MNKELLLTLGYLSSLLLSGFFFVLFALRTQWWQAGGCLALLILLIWAMEWIEDYLWLSKTYPSCGGKGRDVGSWAGWE